MKNLLHFIQLFFQFRIEIVKSDKSESQVKNLF